MRFGRSTVRWGRGLGAVAVVHFACACSKPQPAPGDVRSVPAGSPLSDAGVSEAGPSDASPLSAPLDADGGSSAKTFLAETRGDSGAPLPLVGDEAEAVLFADAPQAKAARAARCPLDALPKDRVRCLIEVRFEKDPAASKAGVELYERFGVLAGVDHDHIMDGGYRGMLHLVPAVPEGADRRHIEWMLAAFRDFEAFFTGLERYAPTPGLGHGVRYRFRPLALRYMRSVAARTPSAYADGWGIAYNLSGSLHLSAESVRETMFHEIFHLNDGADSWWSVAALAPVFDSIVRKCGTAIPCLTPFTPNATIVRGGTYYSFQPGNGVREYAAELAIRYYREHRAILFDPASTGPRPPVIAPFKCGPASNARAWELIVQEFFGGIDLVPPCAAPLTK